jgi:hypothetical protein
MAHAYCILDTKGYIHTLRIYNTYCFSIATVAAGTRLNNVRYTYIVLLSYCG